MDLSWSTGRVGEAPGAALAMALPVELAASIEPGDSGQPTRQDSGDNGDAEMPEGAVDHAEALGVSFQSLIAALDGARTVARAEGPTRLTGLLLLLHSVDEDAGATAGGGNQRATGSSSVGHPASCAPKLLVSGCLPAADPSFPIWVLASTSALPQLADASKRPPASGVTLSTS